jgi:hypothetical protein
MPRTGQRDRVPTAYRERLWPGAWLWALLVPALAALAVAYGRALGAWAGWLVAMLGTALVALATWRTTPEVRVDDTLLRAGPASLPLELVGRVVALEADGAARARGPQGDPTAHVVLRPGVGPGAVVVEVADPEDPHRTWLIASRHPEELVRAIVTQRGRLGS